MATLVLEKKLTRTDINSKLSVPTRCLNHFPVFGQGRRAARLIVKDLGQTHIERYWSLRLAVRRRGYAKPVIGGEWRKFVDRKGLKPGDVVLFFEKENEATSEVSYGIKPVYGFI
ncbi:hypothetical protein Pint_29325 [Pistacia integerrima]|uniref:Uncharacterized protein n=1 Tax=Pistacia integerrima TaxID=434235 RepID=A0ACC0X0S5_9ROSI|nr:hypothetical protein Pint_29325 [Pistacia integerrima]